MSGGRITPALEARLRAFRSLPLNADYPHHFSGRLDLPFRSSDHDPLAATFGP